MNSRFKLPMLKNSIRLIKHKILDIRSVISLNEKDYKSYEVLCFDVFDTLICRQVFQPQDVFKICSEQIAQKKKLEIGEKWLLQRKAVEADIQQQKFPREASLIDIYTSLGNQIYWSNDDLEDIIALEIELEKNLVRPIAPIIHLVNTLLKSYPHKKFFLLSDTYYDERFLRSLLLPFLDLKNFTVISSADVTLTKRSGEIFDYLINISKTNPEKIIHIGDNLHSDVTQPRRKRISVAPFLSGNFNRYELKLVEHQNDSLAHSVTAGCCRAGRLSLSHTDSHQQTIWEVSCSVIAPFLFQFVRWTIIKAQQLGIKSLYFLSRDGQILQRIANSIKNSYKIDIDMNYLYVSRQSLHFQSFYQIGERERTWIFENYYDYNLEYFWSRMDISIAEIGSLVNFPSHLKNINNTYLLGAADLFTLQQAIKQPEIVDLILRKAAARRSVSRLYLEQMGLVSSIPIGIVDIGWRGRLQESIALTISDNHVDSVQDLHGFYIDVLLPPENSGNFHTFSSLCSREARGWIGRAPIFEIFCAADHGTVTGYSENNGKVYPITSSNNNIESEKWGLLLQQKALETVSSEILSKMLLIHSEIDRDLVNLSRKSASALNLFLYSPSKSEAEAYGSYNHTGNEKHDLPEEIAIRYGFSGRSIVMLADNFRRYRRLSLWNEGTISRSLPLFLSFPVFKLVHLFRSWKKNR